MADVNNFNSADGSNNNGWIVAVIFIALLLIGAYFAFAHTGSTVRDTHGNTDGTSVSGTVSGSGSATVGGNDSSESETPGSGYSM